MKLEIASKKAIIYSCKAFHYSKSVPTNVFGFSVFNEDATWCGTVVFGSGANNNIGSPYGLRQGESVELVRMALNGKQGSTSKVLSIALKLLKKNLPLVKLVVSYADSEQGHFGTIYQATNWFYVGFSTDYNLIIDGKEFHRRSIISKNGTSSVSKLRLLGIEAKARQTLPRWKYIFPLDKKMIPLCKSLSKPFPKKRL